jgi:hypothetical protein
VSRKKAGDTDNLQRICIRCRHFRWEGYRCSKYTTNPSLVTGSVEYLEAEHCRDKEELCGFEGIGFSPRGNVPF